ncbi:MAG: hypothetical protein OXE50_15120 [Chloroflexi bacterium]|nr:hypothetical protein [Chloroflexota bacterium]
MGQRAKTLHDSPWKGVIVITGGGSRFLSEILSTPGASRTVLQAEIPYSKESMEDMLGYQPEKACSVETAKILSDHAFWHAIELQGDASDRNIIFGLSCTAALATDRRRRGEDRICVGLRTVNMNYAGEYKPFDGYMTTRDLQEGKVTEVIWSVLYPLLINGETAETLQSGT